MCKAKDCPCTRTNQYLYLILMPQKYQLATFECNLNGPEKKNLIPRSVAFHAYAQKQITGSDLIYAFTVKLSD